MTATGEIAVLRVGHQAAVRIRNWCLTSSQETLGAVTSTLTGRVDAFDTVWSKHSPAKIGLWMGESWWVWEEAHYSPPGNIGQVIEVVIPGNPTAKTNFLS